ncbi:hypothetical protein IscW_ISCW006237, partial [Ixodes scapularis]
GPEHQEDGAAFVGHGAVVFRGRPSAGQEHHRRGGHGLHLPDAAVPGGAARSRHQLCPRDGPHHTGDEGLLPAAQGVWSPADRESGDPVPTCGTTDGSGGLQGSLLQGCRF